MGETKVGRNPFKKNVRFVLLHISKNKTNASMFEFRGILTHITICFNYICAVKPRSLHKNHTLHVFVFFFYCGSKCINGISDNNSINF